MSQFLRDALGSDHPLFGYNLAQLEKAAGDSGVDAKLIGDITEKAHETMRVLGLDPADTSVDELYHALNAVVSHGDTKLLDSNSYVVLPIEGAAISFNLHDIIENQHHELPFEKRSTGHGQRALRLEILRRYAEYDRTDSELVHRLAEEMGIKRASDDEYQPLKKEGDTMKPKLLAIGDIFTDAFIELREESAKIIKDESGEWLALPFGQKPPYDHVDIIRSVGPSPNAAVSAARLGLDVSLMAWVGDDDTGREAIEHLKGEHISDSSMVTEAGKKTSYWYVLRYGADRTMLVKSEKYAYEWRDPATKPDWIYLSYIGEDSWGLHEQLLAYLERNPEVKLAFQPGTFHFQWGGEKLAAMYRRAEIVVMNREEAVGVTGASYDDLKGLADAFHGLGPKIVVITDGPKGSYASYDGKLVTIPNYPDPAPPLDRTGAGDAFASTIVSALALGKSMDEALTWAPINSMSVVQKMGAQAGLLHSEDIQSYLGSAPEDYKVTEL